MLSIILVGSSGAMGQTVLAEVKRSEDIQISALIQAEQDETALYPTFKCFEDLSEWYTQHQTENTVIIDFSTPDLTQPLLQFAQQFRLPLVLATTGQSPEQLATIQSVSQSIALIHTRNTSIGINVMQKAVSLLSQQLYELGYDIEIIEKHHRYKQDAPSGTALLLHDAICQPLQEDLTTCYGREGKHNQRAHREVGIHAVRAGNIVGEHTVIFANNQEVIEMTHKAGNKALFAGGAIKAAQFLVNQLPGMYTMDDVIG